MINTKGLEPQNQLPRKNNSDISDTYISGSIVLRGLDPLPRIRSELAASAISPQIASQYFRYIADDAAVEFIAGSELEQVGGHGKQ